MISEVVMPQMGADMTEGTIVRWLKSEGDQVERGEIIAEIETDKANVEIEAFESGVFRKALAKEGDVVDVGTPIAVIAGPNDDVSQYDAEVPAAKTASPTTPPAVPPSAAEEGPPAKAPAVAESLAEVNDEEPTAPLAPGDAKADVAPAQGTTPTRNNGHIRASPVARRMAEERGVDLSTLQGSGPDGRIVLRDVEAAAAGSAIAGGQSRTVPMSKMRQAIARRMAQSKREAPHYYITIDVDMASAEAFRQQFNELNDGKRHVSINDMIVKAAALALGRYPAFNATYSDDAIQQQVAINVCIAVALDDGLIAPAILDCRNKSLLEIADASRDLAQRARAGALRAEEYTGGTFTISNLGAFDVEMLIAIIQPPQTAILGVGSTRDSAVVRDQSVVPGRRMKLALSADHRVTDGAQGATFLNEVRMFLEKPVGLLL